jgi:hypothetical protein
LALTGGIAEQGVGSFGERGHCRAREASKAVALPAPENKS